MRKYLFRIENLLLLCPLLLLLSENAYYKDGAIDIHLHDTYIVLNISHFIIGIFLFFLVPYFLHTILRWKGRRLNILFNLHIFFTLLLFFCTAFFFMKADDIDEMKLLSYFIWSQVVLQSLFIIYSLIVLIKKAQ